MTTPARKTSVENGYERHEPGLHLTQTNLAVQLKLSGVDVERDSISRIEIGTRFVTDYEIRELSKILKVTPAWLLGME